MSTRFPFKNTSIPLINLSRPKGGLSPDVNKQSMSERNPKTKSEANFSVTHAAVDQSSGNKKSIAGSKPKQFSTMAEAKTSESQVTIDDHNRGSIKAHQPIQKRSFLGIIKSWRADKPLKREKSKELSSRDELRFENPLKQTGKKNTKETKSTVSTTISPNREDLSAETISTMKHTKQQPTTRHRNNVIPDQDVANVRAESSGAPAYSDIRIVQHPRAITLPHLVHHQSRTPIAAARIASHGVPHWQRQQSSGSELQTNPSDVYLPVLLPNNSEFDELFGGSNIELTNWDAEPRGINFPRRNSFVDIRRAQLPNFSRKLL